MAKKLNTNKYECSKDEINDSHKNDNYIINE
jgi:hypothetical protein